MRLLRKHTITLTRHSGDGYWDAEGKWHEGGTVDSQIACSVQPAFAGGIFQKTLPDGIHQKDCRTVHTKTLIIAGSEKEEINSDYVTIDGLEYEVYEVQPWGGAITSNLFHYQALVIRRDRL